MDNSEFMGVSAIRDVGFVCARDMFNMSAVNFAREWRLFYQPKGENVRNDGISW